MTAKPDDAMRCKQDPGVLVPVIDRNRCEGKGPCVVACPCKVLVMGTLGRDERRLLPWKGRLKALAHGGRQAFLANPAACEGCGRCVSACPEKAITLARVGAG